MESGQKVAQKASKKPSLRRSINAFCRSCIYDSREPGAWRQQVAACTSPDCPLYAVRPKSRAKPTNVVPEALVA